MAGVNGYLIWLIKAAKKKRQQIYGGIFVMDEEIYYAKK
jgi:hypothetical protein